LWSVSGLVGGWFVVRFAVSSICLLSTVAYLLDRLLDLKDLLNVLLLLIAVSFLALYNRAA
jgi:hypothetical protein